MSKIIKNTEKLMKGCPSCKTENLCSDCYFEKLGYIQALDDVLEVMKRVNLCGYLDCNVEMDIKREIDKALEILRGEK